MIVRQLENAIKGEVLRDVLKRAHLGLFLLE
jgi:hypothetical protein